MTVGQAIPPMLHQWVRVKRTIWSDADAWDGYESLNRVRSDIAAYETPGPKRQRFPEVYRGDALLIQRAMQGMEERVRWVLYVHLLIAGSSKTKARLCDLSPASYWVHVARGMDYLAGRLAARIDAERCDPV